MVYFSFYCNLKIVRFFCRTLYLCNLLERLYKFVLGIYPPSYALDIIVLFSRQPAYLFSFRNCFMTSCNLHKIICLSSVISYMWVSFNAVFYIIFHLACCSKLGGCVMRGGFLRDPKILRLSPSPPSASSSRPIKFSSLFLHNSVVAF
jgi:hypothetical protein